MYNLIGAKRGLNVRGQSALVLVCAILCVLATRPYPTHGAGQTLFINEIMVSNSAAVLDTDTTNFSDWIEIYNADSTSADLGGMYLSDDPDELEKWRIPSGTTISAGGYLLFWADGLDEDNHTLFKLKHDGEIITLSDDNGTPVDVLDYTALPQIVNVSFGRQVDGGNSWVYFDKSTPASSNSSANSVIDAAQIAAEPDFSRDGGFYSGSKSLSLSASEPGATIYYTIDGSMPDEGATLYSGSINITETTVVRARTYAPGYLPSRIATATFFIDEFSTLPVVSISVEPEFFFDDDIGLYVKGSGGTENYYQDWKRPIHLEMYETDGTMAFSFDGGVELHGNYSRRMPMKSLHVFTGDQYDSGDVDYQIFDDKKIDEFESFILRNSGSDFSRTLYRDAMMQELVKDQFSDIDYQAYRPAIVFLNGEYWGIHNFREKINKTYPEANHGADPDNLDMLRDGNSVMEGDRDQFNDILDFISSNDMTNIDNYEYVKSLVDVGEFMNYMIAEVYYGNIDWPANNVKFWREREEGSRWRWILFDMDQGFNPRDDDLFTHDTVDWVTQSNTGFIRELFNGLSESPEFTAEFSQRFATHINITFEENRVIDIIDTMQADIAPEMPRHINAWKSESPRIASLSDWEENVELMRDFARQRPDYIYDYIDDGLNLNGTAGLTINIEVADGGIVLIHSVEMPGNSLTGTFFRNIPIRLEAIPNPGHRFVEWQETGVTDLKTTHTISGDDTLTAVFETYTPPNLVINEIHYNPAPAQGADEDYEFIELYNADSVTIDLTGFRITKGLSYTFTTGTIDPGEYIVLTSNPANYSGNGYQVFGWDPLVHGKLDNAGEEIRIKDKFNIEIDVVQYNDKGNWVTTPDGDGPSLELIAPNLENAGDDINPSAYYNWVASDIVGGTPGRSNDDTPRILINESANATEISEAGLTDTYQVLLNTYPTDDVEITITPDNQLDLGNGVGNPISLTFTITNALTPQTVLITAVDDIDNEGTHTGVITHVATSNDGDYDGMAIDDVTATILDNDIPGITLVKTTDYVAVTEGSTTSEYTLALESIPADDVVITIDPNSQLDLGNGAGASIDLTFTAITAREPQTVTITAVDDILVEGPHTGMIEHTVSSSDGGYDDFSIEDITVQITDNDVPGVIFTGTNIDIEEGGSNDSYTIALESIPTSNVKIEIDPDDQTDLGNGAGQPITLNFTPGNALNPKTVNVKAVNDNVVEGLHFSDITHTITSGDSNYDEMDVPDIVANIEDDDEAGITITQTDGSIFVSEDGITDTYTIVLDKVPASDVTVKVDPKSQLDIGRGPSRSVSLVFTPENALIPQTVTVWAVDDTIDEGPHTSKIYHSVESYVASYDALELPTLRPDIEDNDTAGLQVLESDGFTQVTEGSLADSYEILFGSTPEKDVTITLTPSGQLDLGNGAGQPITMLVKPEDAFKPHIITVTAVDDGISQGSHGGFILHSVTSNDDKYDRLTIANLFVVVVDLTPSAVTVLQTQATSTQPSASYVALIFSTLLLLTAYLLLLHSYYTRAKVTERNNSST